MFAEASDGWMSHLALQRVVIAVAKGKRRDATDPLSSGERRQLIEAAVAADVQLSDLRGKVRVEVIPCPSDPATRFCELDKDLPPGSLRVFVSGNPSTLAELHATGLLCARLQNRSSTRALSGTRVRDLIVDGSKKAMREAGRLLPPSVLNVMRDRDYVGVIRSIARGE